MSEIKVGSTEDLSSFSNSLAKLREQTSETMPRVQAQIHRISELLESRVQRCRREIDYWQSRIDNADEDESTGYYYEARDEWEERLAEVRSWIGRVEEVAGNFKGHEARLETFVHDSSPKAVASLSQTIRNIDEYAALRIESSNMSGGGASASVSSGKAALPFYGYQRPKKDSRDWLWTSLYGPVPSDLPARSTEESFIGPAMDQGKTPQCVCYSLVGLKRHDESRLSEKWPTFDPDQIYRQCKSRDGLPGDGTTIRDAMKVATKTGLIAKDYENYRVKGYARLESAEEIKHALSLKKVVMLGVQISSAELSGLDRDAYANPPLETDGGHCMLVVGYDDDHRAFRVRNSWGTEWADSGHFWLPYSYLLLDPDFEAWTTVCEKVDAPQESVPEPEASFPSREVSTSNFAWFDPKDIKLSPEDGEELTWSKIPKDTAAESLKQVEAMRPFIELANLTGSNHYAIRQELASKKDSNGKPLFTDESLSFFDLYFGPDNIRIEVDGQGGFSIINGRHRIFLAQQLGIASVPVSLGHLARKQLKEKIARANS